MESIAQDAIVMNVDDLLCEALQITLCCPLRSDETKITSGEVISAYHNGTEEVLEMLRHHGMGIFSTGGVNADVAIW